MLPELPHYHLPNCGSINPLPDFSPEHSDPDSRGLLKLWEPPKPRARYVMGIDATVGIINWDRYHRNIDDRRTDNGAIEIIRCGNGRDIPDVQVAEYAAPIDAEDLADIAVLLGRLYAGNSELGEACCIPEVWPGPGLLTLRRMINSYGYTNFFRAEYLDSIVPKAQNSYGWQSTAKTLQLLWSRGSKHLGKGLSIIRSTYLYDELSNLQNIPGKTFPQPAGDLTHDDRVRAYFMAIWAAHDWSLMEMPEPQKVSSQEKYINYQASDCSEERMYELWEEQYQDLINN